MQRGSLDQLVAFVAVARERSLTAAAAKLNISQSALSHTLRELEERLGVRLLPRTTRNVSPTEAGERLLRNVGPRLDEIASEVDAVRELRDKLAGTIRITATEFAIDAVLLPKLAPPSDGSSQWPRSLISRKTPSAMQEAPNSHLGRQLRQPRLIISKHKSYRILSTSFLGPRILI
jgi:DNA-binding MarR family transcriptional regulator